MFEGEEGKRCGLNRRINASSSFARLGTQAQKTITKKKKKRINDLTFLMIMN